LRAELTMQHVKLIQLTVFSALKFGFSKVKFSLKKNKLSLWVRALRGKLVEDLSNLRIVQMRIHRRYKNA